MEERETKQVLVIRRDLKMRRGKEIAQGGHGALAWLTSSLRQDRHDNSGREFTVTLSPAELNWIQTGGRKITVTVKTLEEMTTLREQAHKASIRTSLITDRGDTEFNGVPTVTVLAIGPDWSDRIDPITKDLPLY